jgi:hypothetical protein
MGVVQRVTRRKMIGDSILGVTLIRRTRQKLACGFGGVPVIAIVGTMAAAGERLARRLPVTERLICRETPGSLVVGLSAPRSPRQAA